MWLGTAILVTHPCVSSQKSAMQRTATNVPHKQEVVWRSVESKLFCSLSKLSSKTTPPFQYFLLLTVGPMTLAQIKHSLHQAAIQVFLRTVHRVRKGALLVTSSFTSPLIPLICLQSQHGHKFILLTQHFLYNLCTFTVVKVCLHRQTSRVDMWQCHQHNDNVTLPILQELFTFCPSPWQ